MASYAAFLRGINVGGHKPVPMEKLKHAFESLRFKNVRTLLASGNVVFEAPATSRSLLEKKIEDRLEKTFGTEIGVLIRTIEELNRLSESEPIKGTVVTPHTRLYVTFLSERPGGNITIPYESPDGSLRILRVSPREVCSVLTLSAGGRTVELMNILEKKFGKQVTTRNWNTIVRLLKNVR